MGQRYHLSAHPPGHGLHLSLVTDAFSRRIVGHYVHATLHTTSCLAALDRAVRGASRAATSCIHHSDRGRTW